MNYTRVLRWPKSNLFLKMESEQVSGSFKARGGGYKLISLTEEQRKAGITTASSGNHGGGVSLMAKKLGIPMTCYVPLNASVAKIAKIRDNGALIEEVPGDRNKCEIKARKDAGELGQIYVSPYNDPVVVAGQGTVGKEIYEQVKDVETIYCSIGGGGLIGGIGSYFRSVNPTVEIVGVLPAFSPAMHICMKVGKTIDGPVKSTLSDGTAGNVEPGSMTLPLCQKVVDKTILTSEEEIGDAMRLMNKKFGVTIEGAAGCALAGYFKDRKRNGNKKSCVVICGSNICPEKFARVIAGENE